MIRMMLVAAFASFYVPHPASACGISSCPLPAGWHMEDARYRLILDDEWSWMNHDLAEAREALAHGDVARASNISNGLKLALQLRRPDMEAGRGKARVSALEQAIDDLSGAQGSERAVRELHRLEGYTVPDQGARY